MTYAMELADFLQKSDITVDEWHRSGADWVQLSLIANDFISQLPALTSAAEQISSRVRTFDGVHSVRWRIKDVNHLLKKIVRKKLSDPVKEKWATISVENYLDVVTDLVGVRALHLFKDECVGIDSSICDVWETCESVIVYIRKGDDPIATILERGGRAEVHDAGYRSIHYIIKSQPEKKILKAEIQVRTIFQEAWSEIDHKVKYPDHTKNEQIKVFLDLFNVLAGSADEMGSFVKGLTQVLKESDEQKNIAIQEREAAVRERDKAMEDIVRHLNELDAMKAQDSESQAVIKKMKEDMDRLRESQSLDSFAMLAEKANRMIRLQELGSMYHAANAVGTILGGTLNDHAGIGGVLRSMNLGDAVTSLKSAKDNE
ncbi:RelA/SpoT domain-containing protein [Pseudomonas sp. NFACC36]|uniref:RelA/SpoT domain-containing protein n=1 Tax=Pseudomonas sp. NFACC36 TaxID=1566197 RepID=UPI000915A930|nr:hypothetical protein [Pseudomonas sp. NFACC36]SFY12137.1 ppGpp synthetase catalytic domain-containing protein (RelA/SpoT-type nucleotidyltranferase) [Pseudomonas sp. NFACC36]